MRKMLPAVVTVALLLGAINAQAAVIGYCFIASTTCTSPDATTTTNTLAAIAASGNTAQALTGLGAANLTGLNVLWILNGDNLAYGTVYTGNQAGITSWINGGGVLSFHDRAIAAGTSAILPGGGGITFNRLLGTDINIQTGGTLVTTGPGGSVTNTNLDGGNSSDHGFATIGSLPAGATAILNNGTTGNIVDFTYRLGAGAVYYSSIPMDFYLSGSGNNPPRDNFNRIYAPNELAYQVSLAAVATPEPSSILLLSGGILGLVILRRKSIHS